MTAIVPEAEPRSADTDAGTPVLHHFPTADAMIADAFGGEAVALCGFTKDAALIEWTREGAVCPACVEILQGRVAP